MTLQFNKDNSTVKLERILFPPTKKFVLKIGDCHYRVNEQQTITFTDIGPQYVMAVTALYDSIKQALPELIDQLDNPGLSFLLETPNVSETSLEWIVDTTGFPDMELEGDGEDIILKCKYIVFQKDKIYIEWKLIDL